MALPEDLGAVLHNITREFRQGGKNQKERREDLQSGGCEKINHVAVNNVKLGQHLAQRAWGLDAIVTGLCKNKTQSDAVEERGGGGKANESKPS